MGWIYNGEELLKANKAQQDAERAYNSQQNLNAFLANPTGIPTIALTGVALVGGYVIGPQIKLFIMGILSLPEDIAEAIENGVKTGMEELKGGAEEVLTPVDQTVIEVKDCIEQAKIETFLVGRVWLPASIPKYWACMLRKGYSRHQADKLLP